MSRAGPADGSNLAELVFEEFVEDIVREVCFPLHRALKTTTACLSCGKVGADSDGAVAAPLAAYDDFERKLISAIQQRAAKLADRVVSREPGLDVFGTKPRTVAIDNFKCSHCGKKVAGNRFAKHLEGCMLGGGRASARIADSSQVGKEPSPAAKRSKGDARASPQTLFPPAPAPGGGLPDADLLVDSIDASSLIF